MNGWKLVPVEPDQSMCQQGQWRAQESRRYPLRIVPIYQAMIAAAPTPPVVLPPLPKSVENKMSDFAVACARGGHEQRVDSANALRREIEAYARAALAQYGIKEQSDE